VTQFLLLVALSGSIASVKAQGVSAGERTHGFCGTCHGINGRSFKVNYPILAGQAAPYILRQLHDFKEGRRSDPIMNSIMPALTDEDMRNLAVFFAASEPHSSTSESDPIRAIRGKKLAESAECISCHARGSGASGGQFPRIEGQHRSYLVKQLKDFRDGRRANDRGIMHRIAESLTDADIEDLGNYFAAIRLDSLQQKRRFAQDRLNPAH
jgi:cytochrome c553